ncbi:hypothetical protein U9M48_014298 [Paspalum notatum var. saurae]|uniref:RING-type E3 ubiquitin transferase n=1 Tax=Paspalum notatum var. saurae TaxID=547442 RepID=A0AAQ3T1B3_PASNO
MGAARPRRWKLPFHHRAGASSAPSSPSSATRSRPSASPARSEPPAAVEAVPEEFLCPISRALMADPVILPSGRTYERACLQACAALAFLPPGADSVAEDKLIPNAALKAAIGTWCARAGREPPEPPEPEAARRAVRRAMPPPAAGSRSVRTNPATARRPEAVVVTAAAAAAASTSNSSYTSTSSSYGSASEITAVAEDEGKEQKPAVKEEEAPEPEEVDPLEDEVVGKVMRADEEGAVAGAMAALREATRESAARRRALCTPRLLGALRRVLLLPRHACARADAAAALVNLSLEPGNKVRIVRAGAVPALVDLLLRSPSGNSEAREHAAGALFGLALHEDNRAAIGVLGAVPPLLELLASPAHPPRARRDAGMALYHLSLAAVNQSKLARLPGAAKALLATASKAGEPVALRRLALMVACNVAACAEGRAALMDAGAVASVSAILLLSDDGSGAGDLEEWCVSLMYALSRGSLRFRGLARAAGADRALRRVVADEACAGVRREMARKTLRAMRRGDPDDDGEYDDLTGSSVECGGEGEGEGEDCGGSIVSDGLMSFRRRQRELGASSCGNTAEF